MTVADIIDNECSFINDDTQIFICKEGTGTLARGDWYSDNVLKYREKEISGFSYHSTNRAVYIDLK